MFVFVVVVAFSGDFSLIAWLIHIIPPETNYSTMGWFPLIEVGTALITIFEYFWIFYCTKILLKSSTLLTSKNGPTRQRVRSRTSILLICSCLLLSINSNGLWLFFLGMPFLHFLFFPAASILGALGWCFYFDQARFDWLKQDGSSEDNGGFDI